jgi:hypothetical protein
MIPVTQEENNVNFSSIYTPEIFFDEWSPCITAPWSRIFNEKTRSLQPEWEHLNAKTATYFPFTIPEKAIHGLLFMDNGKCFFRDHYKGRLSKLRIRNALKGMNIIGAFWVPHQQLLIIHDIYMFNSSSICESVFTERWKTLAEALELIENDEHLQGFTLQFPRPANENAGSSTNAGGAASEEKTACLMLQPNAGLAVVIHSIPLAAVESFSYVPETKRGTSVSVVAASLSPTPTKDPSVSKKIETEALIKKHSKFNGPESFQLWNIDDGSDMGMPCIQSLKLIQAVRTKLKEIDEFIVKIKWNKNLNSYEVFEIKE